jgi:hypothetical protein
MQIFTRQSRRCSIAVVFCFLALGISNVATVKGQETAPKRGFQPGGSYALSDLETINTTNGNLMMHFPLASLPAGRNGLTASINLLYNSKIYNSHTEWIRDDGRNCQYGSGEPAPVICPYYQETKLGFTNDGGWNYSTAYWLELVDRNMEGSLNPNMHCTEQGVVADGYMPMTYIYKLKIHFPDGSVHELRPYGYTDLNGEDEQRDYFNIRPDGWVEDCYQGGHWSTASVITYYSTDGTYLRLDFQPHHDGWWNDPWTLYLPDGMRVTSGSATEGQRIYDRNNNYVERTNVTNYQGTGHEGLMLADQLGRNVAIEYGSAAGEDSIHLQGVGEELVWKIHWSEIYVWGKTYWPCPDGMTTTCQTGDTGTTQYSTPQPFSQSFNVVDRITLPAQAGNLHYDFSYNAPYFAGTYPPPGFDWLGGIEQYYVTFRRPGSLRIRFECFGHPQHSRCFAKRTHAQRSHLRPGI